ncbi:flotillin-like protein 4 [Nymphaea colorata]|nr:flotillin-like protein 4 [Nymphaea colorata]
MMWYKVAKASEFLAITGYGIKDIKLAKKAWILPGQCCTTFDISPVNYTFEVQAMSAEKLPFLLPAVFTIGPRVDNEDCLLKYARLITPHDKLSSHVKELVQGIIEGETRVLAASMTMEEIFRGTKEFKSEVFGKVQLELNQFGLLIYNANVKQLVDVQGHEYFSYLGQKTQMEAANQAKVEVAEARMKGEVGSKLREGQTLQNAAKVDADTKIYSTQREGESRKAEIRMQTEVKVFENEREAEVAEANSELTTKKAEWSRQAMIADVEAAKAVAIRDAELQQAVEMKKAAAETERLRAQMLSKANVELETKMKDADSVYYQKKKAAEASLFEKEKEAEGRKVAAEAAFFAKQQEAEAELYAQRKAAEARVAAAEAEAYYVGKMLAALGGDYMALRDYIMIKEGVYQEIAKTNAQAVNGLNPKISVWNNGSEGVGSGDGGAAPTAMKQIAGVYKMLPPLFETVHEQTGMLPPTWMGSLKDDRGRGSRKIMWYKVAKPAEYLAITGYGIKDIKLAKKAWILPGQSCITFDVSPVNYTLEVQAMSAENLPFLLPAVFTIGPRVDNPESLLKYARLIPSHAKPSSHVKELVEGIIEGETRVVAASMTNKELFKGTKGLKSELLTKVQLELNQFGLLLYHANVKQFLDVPGHEYFSYSGQKTQMVAANQAKVHDAEARMKEVGSKTREGQTFQNAKKVDADTKICSTQRQEESRTLTEVNLIQKEWVPEVVKELITIIECSYSDSCGQTETCNSSVDNGVVSW